MDPITLIFVAGLITGVVIQPVNRIVNDEIQIKRTKIACDNIQKDRINNKQIDEKMNQEVINRLCKPIKVMCVDSQCTDILWKIPKYS